MMQPGSPSRKCARRDEQNDMLLDLPEHVLAKILSLMPTKDAVRTSVLSKNWEYKWTLIHSLTFYDKYLNKEHFTDFVERVLAHYNTAWLDKFTLRSTQWDGPRLSSWISFAIQRKVHRIELHTGEEPVRLPECIYEHISLNEFIATSPTTFQGSSHGFFKNLKVLKLRNVTINNLVAQETLGSIDFETFKETPGNVYPQVFEETLSFPVLEVFEALCCKWNNYKLVNIEAPSLVNFRIGFSKVYTMGRRFFQCKYRIYSLNLRRFEYEGGEHMDYFVLPRPSLVTDATYKQCNVCPFVQLPQQVIRLFSQLSQVRCLHLSLEVLVDLTQPMIFLNLETVIQLKVSSLGDLPMSVLSLLKFLLRTPNVNTLTLEMRCYNWSRKTYHNFLIPPCLENNFEKVRFEYSEGYRFGRNDLKIMQYLVKNAASLEKIEIDGKGNKAIREAKLRTVLLTETPKASPKALEVEVK